MVNLDRIKKVDLDDVLGAVGLSRRNDAAGIGTFFIGLGIGLLGGAAAALLLTPFSGSETREKLVRTSGDLSRQVKTKVNELASNIRSENGAGTLRSPMTGSSYNAGTRVGSI